MTWSIQKIGANQVWGFWVQLYIRTELSIATGQSSGLMVTFGQLSSALSIISLSMFTAILIPLSVTQFWCVVAVPLNSIFWSDFNSSCIKFSALKIALSVWYVFASTPYLWFSLTNFICYLIVSIFNGTWWTTYKYPLVWPIMIQLPEYTSFGSVLNLWWCNLPNNFY